MDQRLESRLDDPMMTQPQKDVDSQQAAMEERKMDDSDYRMMWWKAWIGLFTPFSSPMSMFCAGREVTADTVIACDEETDTVHLAEIALFGPQEARLLAVMALGEYSDETALNVLVEIALNGDCWGETDEIQSAAQDAALHEPKRW